jgi:hypothetical protein
MLDEKGEQFVSQIGVGFEESGTFHGGTGVLVDQIIGDDSFEAIFAAGFG